MFKTVTVLVAGAAALGLAACAPGYHGPNETAGTAVGAIGGGLIGSQFGHGGGSVAGAAVGALLGGALGNTVGRSADAQSQRENRKQ